MMDAIPPELIPNVDDLITEDDTPVDNIFSEKQQRLLTESLYSSWAGPGEGRPFVVLANVGLFYGMYEPPLVPDVMLSLDVRLPSDPLFKRNRSYFIWEYGKQPDVVIEVVSNQKGGELSDKMREYERIRILYYVVFDPFEELGRIPFRLYELHVGNYVQRADGWLEEIGLGLKLWQGAYEGVEAQWLRWSDRDGMLIPSGSERADQEHERADQEHERAEQEHQRAELERERAEQERERADQERERAERLAARLRELGIDAGS
jgi:Uma2 family endonuclease